MARRLRNPIRKSLSDQLREIIDQGPMSRYALSKASGVGESQLSKFMHDKCRLTNETMDAIGKVLRLRLVQDDEE